MTDYVHAHYREDLSLGDLADRFRVTPSYVSQLFKERHGENFVAYVARYRIERVKALLAVRELSIGQIALETGYNNAQQLDPHVQEARRHDAGRIQTTAYRRFRIDSRSLTDRPNRRS
ncbi:helix-turn-helix domain-containing protein [Cohnella rhizosphaerae]|uniref:helix-turn-helix domain-containing protein n=1 Tax=Cohnella rhizosphaerae TaxID=1457232 RepID=UPI003B8A757B